MSQNLSPMSQNLALALVLPMLVSAQEGGAVTEPPPQLHMEELAPLPSSLVKHDLSFSNPFKKYPNGDMPGWRYGGDATLTNDYISLTPPTTGKHGFIWTEEKHSFEAWEAELIFHIGGSKHRGAGGGMAFWYTAEPGVQGPVYGHTDTYEGLGIFFDTFEEEDGNEPFIVAMMNFGEKVGGGSNPNYFKNQVGVCFAGYRNLPHAGRVRIAWTQGRLRVWIDIDHLGKYQNCMATEVDDNRMKLPAAGHFGITASTGAIGDAHVVYSFTFANLTSQQEIQSAAYTGIGLDKVAPEHVLHSEARHHETQVPIATAQTLDANESAPATGHVQAAPAVESEEYLMQLWESMHELTEEMNDFESRITKLIQDSQASQPPSGETNPSLRDEVQTSLGSMVMKLSETADNQDKRRLDDFSSLKRVLDSLERQATSTSRQLADLQTSLKAEQLSIKGSLEASLERLSNKLTSRLAELELKKSSGGGSSSLMMLLGVVVLLVVVGIYYKQSPGGRRSKSNDHLP